LAPSTAGSTYRKYVSPAAFGRRLAAGPFSSLQPGYSDRLLAPGGDPGRGLTARPAQCKLAESGGRTTAPGEWGPDGERDRLHEHRL